MTIDLAYLDQKIASLEKELTAFVADVEKRISFANGQIEQLRQLRQEIMDDQMKNHESATTANQ